MSDAPHAPVLLAEVIAALAPAPGDVIIDATFGAGGYTRAILDRGAQVIGLDRDPTVQPHADAVAAAHPGQFQLIRTPFSGLAEAFEESGKGKLDGAVFDIGVSSMQLDQAERGFSFLRDGPLDMRMGGDGPTAADLLNTAPEQVIADVLYLYGEERASRRIAKAIVAARPLTRTGQLSDIVGACLPRPKPGHSHPSTRSFQAIRIWVNDEFGQLVAGLAAAERALRPGGKLAVVSFHSLEDRIVKRFMQARSNSAGGGSRYAPETERIEPAFTLPFRRAFGPDETELATNPRSRSALLRVGIRTHAPAGRVDPEALGLPVLPERGAR